MKGIERFRQYEMFKSNHATGEIMDEINLRIQINTKGVEFYYFY